MFSYAGWNRGRALVPGLLLSVMFLWWVLPFFLIELDMHPLRTYWASFLPFFITFGLVAAVGMLLTLAELVAGPWNWAREGRQPYIGWLLRWGYLCLAYGVTAFVAVLTIVQASAAGMVEYFGGDPEGSFGMLFMPSAFLYPIGGMFVWIMAVGAGTLQSRLSGSRRKA